MKINLSIQPTFIQAKWFCNLFRISGITLLWWVLHIKPIKEHSYEFKMHERIHSNQQTFLFVLAIISCILLSIGLSLFNLVLPWWIWLTPIAVPFIVYVIMWLIEVVLPPYKSAYYDSPFEREAYLNEDNHDYIPTIFSVWNYFLKTRK